MYRLNQKKAHKVYTKGKESGGEIQICYKEKAGNYSLPFPQCHNIKNYNYVCEYSDQNNSPFGTELLISFARVLLNSFSVFLIEEGVRLPVISLNQSKKGFIYSYV